MLPCHVDYEKFKGFAIRNETDKDIAIIINSEVSFKKEFLLKPMQVYYAKVADLIAIVSLSDAKKLCITEYLKE